MAERSPLWACVTDDVTGARFWFGSADEATLDVQLTARAKSGKPTKGKVQEEAARAFTLAVADWFSAAVRDWEGLEVGGEELSFDKQHAPELPEGLRFRVGLEGWLSRQALLGNVTRPGPQPTDSTDREES